MGEMKGKLDAGEKELRWREQLKRKGTVVRVSREKHQYSKGNIVCGGHYQDS